MSIFSKNKKGAISKKYHYAKGDVQLSFELRIDGTFQLKGFLELLNEARIDVEKALKNVIEILDIEKNKIKIEHKIREQFTYTKDKIQLDFRLRIDIDKELKSFLELLKSAVAEVEEDINNQ